MVTLTIELNAKQAGRVQAAVGDVLSLTEPATVDDARRFLVQQLRRLVARYEDAESVEAARLAAVALDLE